MEQPLQSVDWAEDQGAMTELQLLLHVSESRIQGRSRMSCCGPNSSQLHLCSPLGAREAAGIRAEFDTCSLICLVREDSVIASGIRAHSGSLCSKSRHSETRGKVCHIGSTQLTAMRLQVGVESGPKLVKSSSVLVEICSP